VAYASSTATIFCVLSASALSMDNFSIIFSVSADAFSS